MTKFSASLLAIAVAMLAAPAMAADLPRGVVTEPAPPAPSLANTITIETSPELYATDAFNGSGALTHSGGELADWYAKGTFSHSFGNGFSGSLAIQDTLKSLGSALNLNQQYYEGAVAYKLSPGNGISFSVTGTLGYTAGNTGYFDKVPVSSGTNNDDGYMYYAISGAIDWKVDSHWTWNVINARYRNAFDRTWVTPKVQTGITYTIDSADSVYAAVGYSWKDTGNGQGLLGDKFNFAVGYKYSF